jgi:hypothetical protein
MVAKRGRLGDGLLEECAYTGDGAEELFGQRKT